MLRIALAASLAASLWVVGCAAAPPAADPTPPRRGVHITQMTPAEREVALRTLDQLAPTKVVKRGARVFPLEAGPALGDVPFSYEGEAFTTARYMEQDRVSGVLVVRDGRIVLERYAIGRKPDDRWVSFSVTKSITAMLVGAALKDGTIRSLRDPVSRYVPELEGSAYDRVALRDLLTMRSGVQWNEDYADPEADVWKTGNLPVVGALNPIVRYLKAKGRAAAPGTTFNYNTAETDLLGVVVSGAVGKPLSQYLSEKIWAPFGMEQDALWLTDTGGHERGGCCVTMTLRDYARVGLFMLDGARAGGARIVPEGYVAEATRDHVKQPGYGYFWWVRPGQFIASGIYGQAIYVVPDEKLVVAINSAWPTAWDRTRVRRRDAFVDALRAALRAGS